MQLKITNRDLFLFRVATTAAAPEFTPDKLQISSGCIVSCMCGEMLGEQVWDSHKRGRAADDCHGSQSPSQACLLLARDSVDCVRNAEGLLALEGACRSATFLANMTAIHVPLRHFKTTARIFGDSDGLLREAPCILRQTPETSSTAPGHRKAPAAVRSSALSFTSARVRDPKSVRHST